MYLGLTSLGINNVGNKLDPAASSLIGAMTTPPNAVRQGIINTCIVQLKAAGLWTKLDALYMMAANADQSGRLNWKNPGTWTLAASGTVTFTADQGFKGDGVSGFLSATGYNPSTAGGNLSLNSATVGHYLRIAGTVGSGFDYHMTGGTTRLQTAAGVNAYTVRLNDATSLSSGAGPYGVGHWSARRSDASSKTIWKNGASVAGPDSSVSTTVGTGLNLGASNAGSNASDAQFSFAYTAGSLSDSEMLSLDTILRAYLSSVGAI